MIDIKSPNETTKSQISAFIEAINNLCMLLPNPEKNRASNMAFIKLEESVDWASKAFMMQQEANDLAAAEAIPQEGEFIPA